MFGAERIGQLCRRAGRGGDHAESEFTGQAGLQGGDLVDEGVVVGEYPARPQDEALTVGGQSFEALPTPDQRHLELVLQLADGVGQRRLSDVAGTSLAGRSVSTFRSGSSVEGDASRRDPRIRRRKTSHWSYSSAPGG
jgi:hypothetical protein